MSLFVGTEIQNGEWVVAVDSRQSIRHNGVSYCSGNNLKKYVIHNNKLIITLGSADVMKLFQNYCIEHPDETDIEVIFDTVINSLSEKRLEIHRQLQNINLLSVFEFDIQKKTILVLHYTEKSERIKQYQEMCGFCCSGFKCDEAFQCYEDNFRVSKKFDVLEIFKTIFDFVNCSSVGGIWTLFHITNTGVKPIMLYESGDVGVTYASPELILNAEKTLQYLSTAQIIGSKFLNTNQTTKLALGMDGNLGDLTLTRTADDTQIFQVYDNATNTGLKCRDKQFLYTTGAKTRMQGDWTYNGSEVATKDDLSDIEKDISDIKSKLSQLGI